MRAVGYMTPGPIDREGALIDFEMDRPHASGRDLLIRIKPISVNPVDYKIRQNRPPEGDSPAVLGWDAVGEVVEHRDVLQVITGESKNDNGLF